MNYPEPHSPAQADLVLVTGASGFIGRHLVSYLGSEGFRVRALVRKTVGDWPDSVNVVTGDIRDKQVAQTAAAGCDTIFHSAGKAHNIDEHPQDKEGYRSINIEGTRTLLEAAVSTGVKKFVYFSSVKAMGEDANGIDESQTPKPKTAYGWSKLEAERLVLDCGRRAGIHSVCLRLPMVYGPGNKGNIVRMISAIDRGIFPRLADTGNRRSMVHVTNVVRAAVLAARSSVANGQCFIVADAEPYSTHALYEMICAGLGKRMTKWHLPLMLFKAMGLCGDAVKLLIGRRIPIDSDAVEKLTGSSWYDSKKIANELGYKPSLGFSNALADMIKWYRTAC